MEKNPEKKKTDYEEYAANVQAALYGSNDDILVTSKTGAMAFALGRNKKDNSIRFVNGLDFSAKILAALAANNQYESLEYLLKQCKGLDEKSRELVMSDLASIAMSREFPCAPVIKQIDTLQEELNKISAAQKNAEESADTDSSTKYEEKMRNDKIRQARQEIQSLRSKLKAHNHFKMDTRCWKALLKDAKPQEFKKIFTYDKLMSWGPENECDLSATIVATEKNVMEARAKGVPLESDNTKAAFASLVGGIAQLSAQCNLVEAVALYALKNFTNDMQDLNMFPGYVISDYVKKPTEEERRVGVYKDKIIREVKWKDGIIHPKHKELMSSKKEGCWVPAKGYVWKNPNQNDNFDVVKSTK